MMSDFTWSTTAQLGVDNSSAANIDVDEYLTTYRPVPDHRYPVLEWLVI